MYNIDEMIMCRNEVCKVKDIKENKYNHLLSYVLEPLSDSSLVLEIPVESKDVLRPIITKEELDNIVKQIPSIEIININDTQLENEYKKCLTSGSHLDLVKVIKTAYLRNKKRIDNKKRVSEKDTNYLIKAENSLYREFSIVLDKSYDETKKYIEKEVDKLVKE